MEFKLSILYWLVPLMMWDLAWKALALWIAAQNRQLKWFLAILVFNTAGILPVVYLKYFRPKP